MLLRRNIQLVEERVLFKGRRLVLAERVFASNGAKFKAEVVKFGEAAAIVPIKGDGKIVLINQFRGSLNRWILEVPAGRVNPSESPEETARRELIEEIGYSAKKLTRLASIYMSPGYSDEILHIFLAEDLAYVGVKREKDEIIETIELKLEEAINRCLSEKVADSKTISALFLAQKYLSSPNSQSLLR